MEMEKSTKVTIVAILYLMLGVFYIVLGWNAKLWYPNMFTSNTYYGELGGTTIARISAIVVGIWQVLVGSCLLKSKYYDIATGLSFLLALACFVFPIGVLTSGDDPTIQKVGGLDSMWFFGYWILLAVHVLFWIFLSTHRNK